MKAFYIEKLNKVQKRKEIHRKPGKNSPSKSGTTLIKSYHRIKSDLPHIITPQRNPHIFPYTNFVGVNQCIIYRSKKEK